MTLCNFCNAVAKLSGQRSQVVAPFSSARTFYALKDLFDFSTARRDVLSACRPVTPNSFVYANSLAYYRLVGLLLPAGHHPFGKCPGRIPPGHQPQTPRADARGPDAIVAAGRFPRMPPCSNIAGVPVSVAVRRRLLGHHPPVLQPRRPPRRPLTTPFPATTRIWSCG